MKNPSVSSLRNVLFLYLLCGLTLFLNAQEIGYNSGSGPQYVTASGDTFKVDAYYTPGATTTYTNNTIADILNTTDDVLFRTERSSLNNLGNWGYAIPVYNGTYTVKLYFAEIYFGAAGGAPTQGQAGKRVFDVSIEGVLKLDNYDIFVAAGGAERAIIETFQNINVTDGTMNIDFAPSVNKAKVSAVLLIPINVTPPSNTPPTFTISGNISVNEDFTGTQTVTVTPDPVPPAEAGQTVTYSLSPPSVSFANVTINSSTGNVSITAIANKNGSQAFTITANDGQATNNIATQNFTLTVNAVNDPPAFTLSPGSISVPKNFATAQYVNVTPGAVPSDEMGQAVSYSLTPPSVSFANVSINSSTGQVTITSVSNGSGTQLFTVTANDGQANNNLATQNFTLTVTDSVIIPLFTNARCYNSGGTQYISLAGDTFKTDALFTAGTSTYTNNTIPDIKNTADDAIFRTERNATTFGYDIPSDNGKYTVKLYFAETFYGATGGSTSLPPHTGKRVFNVALEGNTVLSNFDIYAEVGAETATSKSFSNIIVSDNNLDIDFTSIVNKAKISAFCVIADSLFPFVNTPPYFTISGNLILNEDFPGTQTVTVTPNPVPPSEAGQVVTYSLSPPSVSFASVSINASTGNVSVTALLNKNGSQTFTITANDGQASNNIATQNFTLTVNPVNDAPAFSLSPGSLTLTKNFATTQYVNVTPGAVPSDEAGQTVTYSLTPPSVSFANVSINSSTGQITITSVLNGTGSQVFTVTANDGQASNNTASQNFTLTVNDAAPQHSIFINAGGPQYISSANDTFISDLYFSSGTFTSSNNLIPDILNTSDDPLFRTERYAANFNYSIPVQNGTYTIRLYFAEIFFGATGGNTSNPPFSGKRVFDVSIEGNLVLDNYDIFVDAGGAERAIIKQFENINISDGNVTISFASVVNNAKISAIAVIPQVGPPNTPPAVSITNPSNGSSFVEGQPVQINATASDPDAGGSISKVEFYAGATLLGTDNLSPFSFTWNNSTPGNYALTAKAFDNLNASTTSAAVNINVLADAPPVVSITTPSNGASFAAGSSISIIANATDDVAVTNVEFYEGANLLGSDNSSPYSFIWNNLQLGNYSLSAKAYDSFGHNTTSTAVNISVTASSGNTALFVVGALPLNNGDQGVLNRLQALGFSVTSMLASSATTADANGKNLVLISSTVVATNVGSKFTNVNVPVICWEQALLDDLGMTSSASGNSGSTGSGVTQLNIIGAGHPLAAGLSNGLTTVYSSAQTMTWGKPNANATSIATITGSATQMAIFGYESGGAMVNGIAPARRVGLFLHDAGAAFLTSQGTALLDAAITWAANSAPPPPNTPPAVSITNPSNGATFTAPASITIDANASDPDAGGSISKVEFYQGTTLLNTDNSSPFSFNWMNVPAGSYSLTAKAFDNLNASTTSAAVNVTVNPAANTPPVVSIVNPANGATFTAPASITIDANASDPDAGGSISKVEFYQGATLLNTDNSSPFSFNWTNVPAGSYSLTAKAFDNLNASSTSSAVNITVNPVPNIPPTVSITSPSNGNTFLAPASITINANASDADGSISKVEFYEGANLLSIDNSSPFSFNWTNIAAGSYSLTAKAFDNLNASTTSASVNITVNNPSPQGIILLVVGNLTLNNGDNAVKTRLESLGYSVDVKLASAVTTADATGKVLVFISSTVISTDVGSKFTGVTVPVINCEQALHDDLKMVSSASGNAGTISGQTQLNITGAGHPLAAGLPNGLATICTSSQIFSWGVPGTNALKIASYAGNLSNVVIFGYEPGVLMVGLNAPAKRLGFFLENSTAAFLNANGLALFDAAVNWAISPSAPNNPPAVNIMNPANGATFTAPASITIDANASDPDFGGSISKVEFYEGANLLGTDNTSPFSFNWINVPSGSYSLTAKAYDNLNASATSAAINITVNQPNTPPAVSIISPANGATFTAPASITINANASDPDAGGSISKVEFYQGATLLNTDNSSPFSFTWTNVPAGNYSLTAKAYDNLNASATSAAVNITVNPGNNPPSVSITSPGNGASFTAPANITINANASDPDAGGSISKVEFYQGAVLLFTDLISPFSFNWTNVPAGNYSLTAKAFDNLNASTTSSAVNISVNPNNPPVVSITNPANGATFTPPASFTINVSASDPDAGGSISKVEFYQGASLLGTDFTSPYSLTLSGVPAGSYQLTAKAFDNLNASTTSAVVNILVSSSGNQLPAVSITSPVNGAIFTAPASIIINANASDPDGSISKVEFYQGAVKIATSTVSPYTFNWNGVAAGSYQLTAKAFDNLNAYSVSSVINITVSNPVTLSVLFVVGNLTLNSGDAAVKAKLEAMGFTVTVVSDAAATSADATGKTLVVISSTIISSNVNTKFTNVNVPVLTWEPGILDDLKMTGTASTEYGTTFNQTQINITGAGHTLAGGLPNGLTSVFSTVQTTTWGKPNANASAIATIAGSPTQICIFGYSAGAPMFGINAPARRVGFFLGDAGAAALTAAGNQLFEAAIQWASASGEKWEGSPVSQNNDFGMSVYPNPTDGIFNLKLENPEEGKLSVRIFNQLGQAVVAKEDLVTSAIYSENFDLSSQPSGLYLMQVVNGQTTMTRSVIVNGK